AAVAIRSQAAGIVAGSSKPLTFSGAPAVKVSPGATMIREPVLLKVTEFADLAIDLFLPGDTGATPLARHSGAYTTSYVAAGNQSGAAEFPSASTITAWYFIQRVE